jgi:hypothetical protein
MKKWIITSILIFVFLFSLNLVSAVTVSHDIPLTSSGTISQTENTGVRILTKQVFRITEVGRNGAVTGAYAFILNNSNDTVATATFSGDVATFDYEVEANQYYKIMVNNSNGGNWNLQCNMSIDDVPVPVSEDVLNWTHGVFNNRAYDDQYFCNIENLTYVPTNDVELISPADNAELPDLSINFTANYTAANGISLTNTTYFIWNASGDVFNNTVLVTINGTSNRTTELIENFVLGDYEWNAFACFENATWSGCEFNNFNLSLTVGAVVNSITYNLSSYETATESFVLNITSPTGYTPTNALLYYNGTSYTSTITNVGGTEYRLSRTLNVPLVTGIGNNSFYFQWQMGTSGQNSTTYNQSINQVSFGLCNASLTVPYVNFTFEDEETSNNLNATIDASNWIYYLGSISVNRTYTYSTELNFSNYAFCFSPVDRSVNLDYSIQYSFTGYPQRRYENVSSYTNGTTNTTLYLLPTADGIYVTYQVISAAEQPIVNVHTVVERQIGAAWEMIGSGDTGDDGGVTFWLNPDYVHRLTFSRTGYDTVTHTHTPTQSTYTIYMTSASTTNVSDHNRGISYSIAPTDDVLNNMTTYQFNFTLSSSYWTLDEFGFILRNSTTTLGSASSTTGTGGTVSLSVGTGNYTRIFMDYYWVIDGNYSNASRSWYVSDTGDYGYSVKTFFDRLKDYTTDGIFGLNEFSRTLIIFFLIFIIVGAMCWVSGVYSPAAIVWEIFALVALFDVGLDMIVQPMSNAIPHFITFITLFIAIGITIWEVKR